MTGLRIMPGAVHFVLLRAFPLSAEIYSSKIVTDVFQITVYLFLVLLTQLLVLLYHIDYVL